MHFIYEHFMLDAHRILCTGQQVEIFLLQVLQFDSSTGFI